MREAQALYGQADYSGAFDAYNEILKKHPRNKTAGEARLQAAMARIRNFSVTGAEDDKSVPARAGVELAGMIRVLEPAAAKRKGREVRDYRPSGLGALSSDFVLLRATSSKAPNPTFAKPASRHGNVYANEMLGNWLLQTHRGSVQEAAAT